MYGHAGFYIKPNIEACNQKILIFYTSRRRDSIVLLEDALEEEEGKIKHVLPYSLRPSLTRF